jgi:hypothetical protein
VRACSWGLIGGVVAGTSLCASAARADGVGGEFFAIGGRLDLHDTVLSRTGESFSTALADDELLLQRDGYAMGGGLRLEAVLSHIRFGLEAAVWEARDVDLVLDDLPPGHTLAITSPVGVRLAAFAGYDILDGPVYPYVDLRVGPSLLVVSARLEDASGTEVAHSDYADLTAGFGPRAGLRVPIVDWALVDLAGYYPILGGHENLTVTLGIALWSSTDEEAE